MEKFNIGEKKDFFFKDFVFLDKKQIASKNFIRPSKIQIIFENEFFAVLYKPAGIPTAPLKQNEENTLVTWFLNLRPDAKLVVGKKEIEAGLIHRLDTPTSGLVLIAKTQEAYNFFIDLQNKNLLEKKYIAIVDKLKTNLKPPKKIISQFRPFGPGQKKVAPVFSFDKRYSSDKPVYTTKILDIDSLLNSDESLIVTCSLKKGYRHQVRSHLASIGLPIKGDALYNPNYIVDNPKELEKHNYNLQLYAVGISLLTALKRSYKLQFL